MKFGHPGTPSVSGSVSASDAGPLKSEPGAQPCVYGGDLETMGEIEPVNVESPGDKSNLCWCRVAPFLLPVNWTDHGSTGC